MSATIFFMMFYFHISEIYFDIFVSMFNAKFVIWKSSWKLYIYYIKTNNNIQTYM